MMNPQLKTTTATSIVRFLLWKDGQKYRKGSAKWQQSERKMMYWDKVFLHVSVAVFNLFCYYWLQKTLLFHLCFYWTKRWKVC